MVRGSGGAGDKWVVGGVWAWGTGRPEGGGLAGHRVPCAPCYPQDDVPRLLRPTQLHHAGSHSGQSVREGRRVEAGGVVVRVQQLVGVVAETVQEVGRPGRVGSGTESRCTRSMDWRGRWSSGRQRSSMARRGTAPNNVCSPALAVVHDIPSGVHVGPDVGEVSVRA